MWVKMAKNSIFWHKKLRQIFLTLGIRPKFFWVVNISIFEWLESFCEILVRGKGWKWPNTAIFGPKNDIFGHFNPLSLIRISQKLSSHSEILSITTTKNFGQIPNAKKIWRNFLCLKILFLPYLPTLWSKFHKYSPVIKEYHYLPLLAIWYCITYKNGQKYLKLLKLSKTLQSFKNIILIFTTPKNFPKISRGGKYCHFWITSEFLWNLAQRKWVKMAKNSIFWHKKLRQIQAVQNLARQPLLPFFGVQLGCPYKNPATVYIYFFF